MLVSNRGSIVWTVFLLFFQFPHKACTSSHSKGMDVRLAENSYNNEGLVEIKRNDQWYYLCISKLDASVGKVLCRELGFDYFCKARRADTTNVTTSARRKISNDDIRCQGNESSISECNWKTTTTTTNLCLTLDSAAVIKCSDEQDVHIRLYGSHIDSEGFVQLRCGISSEWTFIQGGDHWDQREGAVVCIQKGFKHLVQATQKIFMLSRQPPDWNVDFFCGDDLDEKNLLDCDFKERSTISYPPLAYPFYSWMCCGIDTVIMGRNLTLCGSRHTCRNRCGLWNGDGCSCHDRCKYFSFQCCHDYSEHCGTLSNSDDDFSFQAWDIEHTKSFKCLDFRYYKIVVISVCLLDTQMLNQTDHFSKDCRNDYEDDVIARLPVYSRVKDLVFKNVFCALCSGVDLYDITPFEVFLLGRTLNSNETAANDDSTNNRTALILPPSSVKVGTIIHCTTSFKCNSSLCESFFAPVLFDQLTYRNPFCITCSNFSLDTNITDYCSGTRRSLHLDPRQKYFSSNHDYAKPVNINFHFHDAKCDPFKCPLLGEWYDPFLKKCRFLACPPGIAFDRNLSKCIEPIDQSFLANTPRESQTCLQKFLSGIMDEIDVIEAIPVGCNKSTNANVSGPFMGRVTADSLVSVLSIKLYLSAIIAWSKNVQEAFYQQCASSILTLGVSTSPRLPVKCAEEELNLTTVNPKISMYVPLISIKFIEGERQYIMQELSEKCWLNVTPDLNCLETTVVKLGDWRAKMTFISIPKSKAELNFDEVVPLQEGSIIVCSHKLVISLSLYDFLYYAAIIITLLSLLLTFLTYTCFSVLRNLPGVCLMNMVAALFIAHFTLAFSDGLVNVPPLCALVAAISHFTWLASFMWMCVLSYNMARTFGTHSPRPFSSIQLRRQMMWYSLFAWGGPFIIVIICGAQHLCQCIEGLDIQYGDERFCWISGNIGRVYAFILPVAIILACNILLFVFTAVSLRVSRQSTRIVRVRSTQTNDILVELIINIRLIFLLGISWILGYVQLLWPTTVWVALFYFFSCLQGFFIFVMFVLKKNVIKLWLNKCNCRGSPQTTHSTKDDTKL